MYLRQNNPKKDLANLCEIVATRYQSVQAGCCKILSIKNIEHIPSSNPYNNEGKWMGSKKSYRHYDATQAYQCTDKRD